MIITTAANHAAISNVTTTGFWTASTSRDDFAYPPHRSLTKKRRASGNACSSVAIIKTPYADLTKACVDALSCGRTDPSGITQSRGSRTAGGSSQTSDWQPKRLLFLATQA